MKKIVTILLIIIVLLLVACGGGEEETPVPTIELPPTSPPSTSTPLPEQAAGGTAALQSTPWQWISHLDQATGVTSISDPQNYIVDFQLDGSVLVKADCNNATGTYIADDSGLTITMGPMTLAACAEGSRSEQFISLLGGAANYDITDNQLRIDLFADAGNLMFIPEWANPPSSPTPMPSQPTAMPPTAVPPQPTQAPPSGSCVDNGARVHAMGTYAAPYYTVAAGDTIYSIGLRFGITNEQLFAANPGATNGIVIGQRLVIPCGNTPVQPIEPPVAPSYERVDFAPGTVSTTINSSIDYNTPRGFVIRGMAGQTMQINTTSAAEYLNITVQSADSTVLPVNGTNGTANNSVWVTLPYTGDYYVTITPLTPPESPNMNFTITFTIQ